MIEGAHKIVNNLNMTGVLSIDFMNSRQAASFHEFRTKGLQGMKQPKYAWQIFHWKLERIFWLMTLSLLLWKQIKET